MKSYKPRFTLDYKTNNFVNALDEYKERNRKIFDIPEIDEYLFFEDKKNICIANNSSSIFVTNFLHSIIANACINYHLSRNRTGHNNDALGERMTVLVDAGNGNNLGYIYLEIVKKSICTGFNIRKILEQMIIVRAFTFYQLLNTMINEIPKFILQQDCNCKIQIIVIDFLNNLLESSHHTLRIKYKNNYLKFERDFNDDKKLIIEAIDILVNLSNNYFVILHYDKCNSVVNDTLFSLFSNYVEINSTSYNKICTKNKKKTHVSINPEIDY